MHSQVHIEQYAFGSIRIDGTDYSKDVILLRGEVRCWGANHVGQVGDGTFVNASSPVSPVGLAVVTQLTAGLTHTCARAADGAVYCWGEGTFGQIGNASSQDVGAPELVLEGAKAAWADYLSTCAQLDDLQILCWGSNSTGQLQPGGPEFIWQPEPLVGY